MKKYFDSIIGNNAIKERLSLDIESKKVSHAYIFEGEDGCGRHTLAYQLAAAISCQNKDAKISPCGECVNCKKIFSSLSPDVVPLGVAHDKVTIGVETARYIKDDICTAPNGLPIKMYIIEDADKMTMQAQNALLLSLEEPPAYVIFILLCKDSSVLLETIRSRAITFHLEKLSLDDISRYLCEKYPKAKELKTDSPEEFNEILFASNGTLGRAISLLDDKDRKKEMAERAITKAFIETALNRSKVSIFDMMSSLGSKRADIIPRLMKIQHALRDLILLKKADSPELVFYSDIEYATEISTKFTLERLIDMYSALEVAIEDLKANANVRLSLLSMMYAAGLVD